MKIAGELASLKVVERERGPLASTEPAMKIAGEARKHGDQPELLEVLQRSRR